MTNTRYAPNLIISCSLAYTIQKIGLALLVLYALQLCLGMTIHFFKMPFMGGHRPPQNYFHAILGLSIIALAFYQVRYNLIYLAFSLFTYAKNKMHYGINTEWIFYTGIIIDPRAMHAWTALIVVRFGNSYRSCGPVF